MSDYPDNLIPFELPDGQVIRSTPIDLPEPLTLDDAVHVGVSAQQVIDQLINQRAQDVHLPADDGTGQPVQLTTYRRMDGDTIDQYDWVTDLDWFDCEDYPVQLLEEVWVRTTRRIYWKLPATLYDCALPDCDEDATCWAWPLGAPPVQACPQHVAGLTAGTLYDYGDIPQPQQFRDQGDPNGK